MRMKPYYHSISANMWVGTQGRAETQRQLNQEEHYLVFLPIPQKAPETPEERTKQADNERAVLRNIIPAKIGFQESRVPFNRSEFGAVAQVISGEFSDQNTSDFSEFTYWVEQIGDDLGSIRLESVLLRLTKPQRIYVPEMARFVAKEGDKVRVAYLSGDALEGAPKQPELALREICSLF